jgi:hypothetical protein
VARPFKNVVSAATVSPSAAVLYDLGTGTQGIIRGSIGACITP